MAKAFSPEELTKRVFLCALAGLGAEIIIMILIVS